MHLSIITVDVSNEDDDCMTFSMLFDPFLVVVGKRTRKKLSHDNKIQNKKAMDQRIGFISKLDSSYKNILNLNVPCVYSI